MTEPLIVKTIQRYYADWTPPKDTGRTWVSCRCPFHGDDQPSAAISFEYNAFRCHACPVKGDAIAIIRSQEGVSYPEALEITEGVPQRSHRPIPAQPAGKSRRELLGDTGSGDPKPRGSVRDKQVRSRIRGRSRTWT